MKAQEGKESSRPAGWLWKQEWCQGTEGSPGLSSRGNGPTSSGSGKLWGLEKAHQPWGGPVSDRGESVPCISPALSCYPVSFLALF